MFVALHILDFPISAALRGSPERGRIPAGILASGSRQTKEEKLPLFSINEAARQAGVQNGWPLNRSLVRCPGLRVVDRDIGAEAAISRELFGLAESLTPDVEITAPDLMLLDLSYRSTAFVSELRQLRIDGVKLSFAIAATADLAAIACRFAAAEERLVEPEDLASLSIEVLASLQAADGVLGLLKLWGIKTIGAFTALPRQDLAERLGRQAAEWQDLLLGKTRRLLRLHRPPESFANRYDFEDGAASSEPVLFALKGLLHTLESRLQARHLAATNLCLTFHLESGEDFQRHIRLPEPQASAARLLPLLQTLLDHLQLDSVIQAVELDVETTFATVLQRDWQSGQLPQPERWNETIAKLQALLGDGKVGIPQAADSHLPDAFTLVPPGSGPEISRNEASPACAIPLHRFRPPQGVAVMHEMRGGLPWPLAVLNGAHSGQISERRGPYPVSGEWWNIDRAWQRLEWDIQMESRQLLRLVYQQPDHWQLEGIYR